jgi:hypothetical protein
MTGEASLFHVVATDDPAGPTWDMRQDATDGQTAQ